MPMDVATRLRQYLGEEIPDIGADGNEGTDADTMFTEAQILDLLTNFAGPNGDNYYLAAAEGWNRKGSQWAKLVTTAQSGSTRNMSDLLAHADSRASHFLALAYNRRNARVGTIRRPGTTVT